jgi:hypothetical protein
MKVGYCHKNKIPKVISQETVMVNNTRLAILKCHSISLIKATYNIKDMIRQVQA